MFRGTARAVPPVENLASRERVSVACVAVLCAQGRREENERTSLIVLTIYLHRSQEALLDELKEVCPDLEPSDRSAYPNFTTYHSYLNEEDYGRLQKSWLSSHQIPFIDTERVRERRTRAFLRDTALEPEHGAPLSFSFARVENDPDFHHVTLCTRQQETAFYLLPGWTGRERAPFHLWVGAIYVTRQESELVVYGFTASGCLDREITRLPTTESLTNWLLERRYLQIYSLSIEPDPCGFYLYLREDGLPEMLRMDE